ncbi:ribbon-helix-helix protein, CopG family [Thalassomonas sp. RHCl1]|uniref:ribbon-helix-helix domain-containing protein n=1 Tax=Thalassomonas sp. RHCl1 TaxID=2995320 RepID=UPI00248C8144|nr:ribbon-helix-helix protein, CopG family [Thalassomonas sp. RHCl1]
MKKVLVLTVRVESEVYEAIRLLAEEDERSIAWMARRLLREALQARKLLKPPEK